MKRIASQQLNEAATASRSVRDPIRVCLVAPSLAITGGQSRQAARLLQAFANVPALTTGFIPHNPQLPRPFDRLQQIKYVRTVVTTLSYWLMLLARLWRYDIVQVFSASYFSYLLSVAPAILIGKLYGKKVILNYRSGEAEDHLTRWPLTTKPIMQLCDRIVVPSGYLVDVFGKFGMRGESIFNVVELERFVFRQRAPLNTTAPRILSTRLLEPLYNIGNVLRAFHLIQQQIPGAQLTIAGDGCQRAELEALARELKLQNVTFLGFVKFDEMAGLFASHDVFMQANDIDNMPASLLESFASGIPAVTTNAGGIPYILTHNETGLMVECGDYAGLARETLRLLNEPQLVERLTNNAFATTSNYTASAVRAEWVRLYHEMMTGQAPLRALETDNA